ncbi:hypothetical protein CRYUN_Cryun01aG0035400 [Craigia yunnanensis]
MLKLAELCATSGLKVSFLNSEYTHNRLVRFANIHFRFKKYPGYEFRTISDGLPGDHPRSGNRFMEIFEAMNLRTKPLLKDMLVEISPPVDCIIGDGILGYVLDVANELGIPAISFFIVNLLLIKLFQSYVLSNSIDAILSLSVVFYPWIQKGDVEEKIEKDLEVLNVAVSDGR